MRHAEFQGNKLVSYAVKTLVAGVPVDNALKTLTRAKVGRDDSELAVSKNDNMKQPYV